MAKTNDSGLPPAMPRAPGNARAADPVPQHVTAAAGPVPPWMSPEKQKWTKDRIATGDERRRAKAGVFQVGEPQLPTIPFRVVLGDKNERRT
jgi:hypothetical protein